MDQPSVSYIYMIQQHPSYNGPLCTFAQLYYFYYVQNYRDQVLGQFLQIIKAIKRWQRANVRSD